MPDGMGRPMLPAVEKFIAAMRKIFEDGVTEPDCWEMCREHLKELIADPDVKAHAKDWPITGFNPETNQYSGSSIKLIKTHQCSAQRWTVGGQLLVPITPLHQLLYLAMCTWFRKRIYCCSLQAKESIQTKLKCFSCSKI